MHTVCDADILNGAYSEQIYILFEVYCVIIIYSAIIQAKPINSRRRHFFNLIKAIQNIIISSSKEFI